MVPVEQIGELDGQELVPPCVDGFVCEGHPALISLDVFLICFSIAKRKMSRGISPRTRT